MMLLYVIIHNSTSLYKGVSWSRRSKKWQTQLTINQKLYHGGYFDKEKDAAMSINLLCDKHAIKRKNPTINIKSFEAYQSIQPTSKYIGVSWHDNNKKWTTRLTANQKVYNGGYFDKEEDAAMKVNLLCDRYEIQRKNPTIDIESFKENQQFKNKTSKYIGVSWKKNRKQWVSQLMNMYKKYYGGSFDKEEDAAMSVNLLCDKFQVERKNPTVDIKLFEAYQVQKPTSHYTCVSWTTERKKWRVRLFHNGKKYSAGEFDNEKHAAMKVNLLCDKFGIQRKNPTVDMELNAIQQKTKSKIHQSKEKNVMNEKVKVKDENILNGFKDGCENNFIESQKRKRKED